MSLLKFYYEFLLFKKKIHLLNFFLEFIKKFKPYF